MTAVCAYYMGDKDTPERLPMEEFKLGDEIEFTVKAKCTWTPEPVKTGETRHLYLRQKLCSFDSKTERVGSIDELLPPAGLLFNNNVDNSNKHYSWLIDFQQMYEAFISKVK